MADEAGFQRSVLRLRVWLIAGLVLLLALAIAAVVLAVVSGRDAVAIVGDGLTFLTLVAAVAALRYAAESARAALDTVKPLEDMAAKLAATADTLRNIEASQDATASTMAANLELARQVRAEESRAATLERCLRVRSLHYRLASAGWAFQNVDINDRQALGEHVRRLEELAEKFRGAVAFLDRAAFKGAWEEADNIGVNLTGLYGNSGKALAEVEKKILELRTEGSTSLANT